MRLEVEVPHDELPKPRIDARLSVFGDKVVVEYDGECFHGDCEAMPVGEGCLLGCDGRIWDAASGPLGALASIGETPGVEASLTERRTLLDVEHLHFAVGLLGHTEGVSLHLDDSVRAALASWDEALTEEPDLSLFVGELLPHQGEALRWMRARTARGRGFGLLADEMGLGKTVVATAYLACLAAEVGAPRVLVVCPTSVVDGWVEHLERHAPSLLVVRVSGSQSQRASIIHSLYNVAITSYGCLRRDAYTYSATWLDCVIFDEAQALKGRGTKTHAAARVMRAPRRFALSGTPVPNSVRELQALFACLDESYLGSAKSFDARFTRPIEERGDAFAAETLRRLVEPCVKRRLKEEVLSLPPKKEFEVAVELGPEERMAYDALEGRLRERLSAMSDEAYEKERVGVLGELTRLRQAATSLLAVHSDYVGVPAKLGLAADLVARLLAEGRKGVVVHTLFVEGVVDPLRRLMAERGVESDCLTGAVPPRERPRVIGRLLDGEVRALIVTSAGGEGINLQDGADAVLLLTPWYNHALLDQAADRIYRFGQTHEVDVYRLVSHGTVEERMVRMQDRKYESVSLTVLQRSRSLSQLSRMELLAILGEAEES